MMNRIKLCCPAAVFVFIEMEASISAAIEIGFDIVDRFTYGPPISRCDMTTMGDLLDGSLRECMTTRLEDVCSRTTFLTGSAYTAWSEPSVWGRMWSSLAGRLHSKIRPEDLELPLPLDFDNLDKLPHWDVHTTMKSFVLLVVKSNTLWMTTTGLGLVFLIGLSLTCCYRSLKSYPLIEPPRLTWKPACWKRCFAFTFLGGWWLLCCAILIWCTVTGMYNFDAQPTINCTLLETMNSLYFGQRVERNTLETQYQKAENLRLEPQPDGGIASVLQFIHDVAFFITNPHQDGGILNVLAEELNVTRLLLPYKSTILLDFSKTHLSIDFAKGPTPDVTVSNGHDGVLEQLLSAGDNPAELKQYNTAPIWMWLMGGMPSLDHARLSKVFNVALPAILLNKEFTSPRVLQDEVAALDQIDTDFRFQAGHGVVPSEVYSSLTFFQSVLNSDMTKMFGAVDTLLAGDTVMDALSQAQEVVESILQNKKFSKVFVDVHSKIEDFIAGPAAHNEKLQALSTPEYALNTIRLAYQHVPLAFAALFLLIAIAITPTLVLGIIIFSIILYKTSRGTPFSKTGAKHLARSLCLQTTCIGIASFVALIFGAVVMIGASLTDITMEDVADLVEHVVLAGNEIEARMSKNQIAQDVVKQCVASGGGGDMLDAIGIDVDEKINPLLELADTVSNKIHMAFGTVPVPQIAVDVIQNDKAPPFVVPRITTDAKTFNLQMLFDEFEKMCENVRLSVEGNLRHVMMYVPPRNSWSSFINLNSFGYDASLCGSFILDPSLRYINIDSHNPISLADLGEEELRILRMIDNKFVANFQRACRGFVNINDGETAFKFWTGGEVPTILNKELPINNGFPAADDYIKPYDFSNGIPSLTDATDVLRRAIGATFPNCNSEICIPSVHPGEGLHFSTACTNWDRCGSSNSGCIKDRDLDALLTFQDKKAETRMRMFPTCMEDLEGVRFELNNQTIDVQTQFGPLVPDNVHFGFGATAVAFTDTVTCLQREHRVDSLGAIAIINGISHLANIFNGIVTNPIFPKYHLSRADPAHVTYLGAFDPKTVQALAQDIGVVKAFRENMKGKPKQVVSNMLNSKVNRLKEVTDCRPIVQTVHRLLERIIRDIHVPLVYLGFICYGFAIISVVPLLLLIHMFFHWWRTASYRTEQRNDLEPRDSTYMLTQKEVNVDPMNMNFFV